MWVSITFRRGVYAGGAFFAQTPFRVVTKRLAAPVRSHSVDPLPKAARTRFNAVGIRFGRLR